MKTFSSNTPQYTNTTVDERMPTETVSAASRFPHSATSQMCANHPLSAHHHHLTRLDIQSPTESADSPQLDDGYCSSVSSWSTLMQLNREFEDRAFKSTPVRPTTNDSYRKPFDYRSMPSSFDSGLGRTPGFTEHSSGWNPMGQAYASIINPTATAPTGLMSSVVQPFPVGLYTPLGMSPMYTGLSANRFMHSPASAFNSYASNSSSQSPLESMPYRQVLAKVRTEMMSLIENSMTQLEIFFKQSAMSHSNPEGRPNESMADCAPLNLKAEQYPRNPVNQYNRCSVPVSVESSDCVSRVSNNVHSISPRRRLPTTELIEHQTPVRKMSTPKKSSSHWTSKYRMSSINRRRRLRVRTGTQPPRVHQSVNKRGSSRTAVAMETTTEEGTLDLRLKRGSCDNLDEGWGLSDQNDGDNLLQKTLILSASHLKRAKLIFMFTRYPNSSMLKTYFPEVVFTRTTTAQLVKWFSNFREFFYIQIEKLVRQLCARGHHSERDLLITREHELFRTLEIHFNKDDESQTPYEFLQATQLALTKFYKAIKEGHDRDPSWKKMIYKAVSTLDCTIPDFLTLVN